MRSNLQGLIEEIVDISIKEIGDLLKQVEFHQVYYCDGLLLCVNVNGGRKTMYATEGNASFVVWNPYLGQTRWIQPKTTTRDPRTYSFGYDNNKNYKILRLLDNHYEIYDLKSNSWRVFDVIPNWKIVIYEFYASVNGNAYFWTKERIKRHDSFQTPYFFICFDFTAERFGQPLFLPFQDYNNYCGIGILSCVREEKLSMLYQCYDAHVTEIWITTKVEPNAVSWIPFLKFDIQLLTLFGYLFYVECDSFIIDEEEKLAVIFYLVDGSRSYSAYIIGEKISLKKVDLKEVERFGIPIVSTSSYVPSLVQIKEEEEQ